MTLIDGKSVANERLNNLSKTITSLKEQGKRAPGLAVVLVGEDPASQTYVASKIKQSKKVGIESKSIVLKEDTSEFELIEIIKSLNNDEAIDGILVQLPLPRHINSEKIIDSINPNKDVDGLHVHNVGRLVQNKEAFIPCTPLGIMSLLEAYEIDLEGKDVLVIGRSQLVGNPVTTLLKHKNATVTQAHSKTKNIEEKILNHEIIVVATGVKAMVKADMLRDYHIVIDVGIHRENGKLCGDVEKSAYEKVKMITPVPKGVGPMTIVSLLENTVKAYYLKGDNHG
ncbi:bifunctional 5,10-methylenetetrahydrofolate dehydrogenase/5,10-methenyltetrahydrofolate cyclohydrolase [Erysipelothrix urinaevulpis]|uniref:bifunctional 5,10-methylenetetrahydrofolate dehydrogenase/5,10-methenyltetrahydrofolate cyclohydrolase n=1 Tax=Erysipelothrix urinaevulpis TaxID=2683717 RepID=UPI001358C534|nr:bifunctional 5,10-methylenetetrahydrofolate dehydrogenase/5,10-methenyltetrahydrofolate cyclohydrolase [Erysipelothrix urinaevulpis]